MIDRLMIQLSNNSRLTQEAINAIKQLQPQDQQTIEQWLRHAIREQNQKLSNKGRNFLNR